MRYYILKTVKCDTNCGAAQPGWKVEACSLNAAFRGAASHNSVACGCRYVVKEEQSID